MRLWMIWILLLGWVWAAGELLVQVGSPQGEAGLVDGVGTAARLAKPIRLSGLDEQSVLVADINNHAIRQIDNQGRVSTLVGSGLKAPHGVAVNSQGQIAVADAESNQIFFLNSVSDKLTLLAGDGVAGQLDGPNQQARFNAPHSICWGTRGQLYVADIGSGSVRLIDQGKTSTLIHEKLKWPMDLALDSKGQLWIADAGLQTIFKWSAETGLVQPFPDLKLEMPHGLSPAEDGSIYVAEMHANRISRIDAEGQISTVWDRDLLKPAAVLWQPGGLWVADLGHHRVLRLRLP